MTTLSRNGHAPRTFPRQPLLLAPVTWPFRGDGYEGVTFLFSVAAVRDLLDDAAAGVQALSAEMDIQEKAVLADERLSDAEKQTQIDALLLEWAHRIIARAIHSVEWPWPDPPPNPADPTSFDCWDPQTLFWLAKDGLAHAGAAFVGPLSRRAMRSGY